jgi:hypothetical protein
MRGDQGKEQIAEVLNVEDAGDENPASGIARAGPMKHSPQLSHDPHRHACERRATGNRRRIWNACAFPIAREELPIFEAHHSSIERSQ